jgi:VanZ family protein
MPVSSSHGRLPFRRTLRFVAVAMWCGVIFAASNQPDLRVSDDDLVDLVLRKLAHLAVFGVLAALLAGALTPRGVPTRGMLLVAWLTTVAYAASDEWHQTFVPGRSGEPRDVMIDAVGAAAGLFLFAAWRRARSMPRQEHSS